MPDDTPSVRLFLSHSSDDTTLAAALADLFRVGLGLRMRDIRCTSVPEYGLSGGAHTATQLRQEVLSAGAVVGLISASSTESLYVTFELGARWGAGKPLVPVFAYGFDPGSLRGPLAATHGLRSDEVRDLHKLVASLAEMLGVAPESPAGYARALDAVLTVSTEARNEAQRARRAQAMAEDEMRAPAPSTEARTERLTSAPNVAEAPIATQEQLANAGARAADPFAGAEATIRAHCEAQWGDNFEMLDFCLRNQRDALSALRKGAPADIPAETFAGIRTRAEQQWRGDFEMQLNEERRQTEAYRRMRT